MRRMLPIASAKQAKALEVSGRPAGLGLDHGLQGFYLESIAGAVEGDSDSAAIGMGIPLVAALLAAELKSILK